MSLITFVLATAGLLIAGPLDPPAGPIAPTPGPEPRIAINQENTPGNASTVFIISQSGSYYLEGNIVTAESRGISVQASNVTIDLMGYTLEGSTPNADWGIDVPLGNNHITIRNGVVTGWTRDGINCAGDGAIISGIIATANANGIDAGEAAVVRDCVAIDNTQDGIEASNGSIVTNCSAFRNGTNGIAVVNGTVLSCNASSNGRNGINASFGTTVKDCTANTNTQDGIEASNHCMIIDNHCRGNGEGAGDGAGIHVTSQDCRVEGNHCTDADRGIDVDQANNIIVKNTCAGNTTNWVIAAGNAIGPIVLTGSSGAISGDVGTASMNSNHPQANFTH